MATMATKRNNLYNRGIGYILFTAGMILCVWLGSAIWRGYDTYGWQETTGIVYQSDLLKTTQIGDEALFQADISYRYQVEGQAFTGNNLYRTSLPFNTKPKLEDLLANFPVGSIVKLYINPKLSSEAILIKGVQPQLIAGFVFSAVCFVFGLMSFRRVS